MTYVVRPRNSLHGPLTRVIIVTIIVVKSSPDTRPLLRISSRVRFVFELIKFFFSSFVCLQVRTSIGPVRRHIEEKHHSVQQLRVLVSIGFLYVVQRTIIIICFLFFETIKRLLFYYYGLPLPPLVLQYTTRQLLIKSNFVNIRYLLTRY